MPDEAASSQEDAPACPHCGSVDTERMSRFGTVLGTAQFYCRGCSTTFEQMKWGSEER